MKKAILYGASGFVGSHLLECLLADPDYESVTIVVRKELRIKHPKLTSLIGDFNSLPALVKNVVADEIFIALGTTKKKSPNEQEYFQVDHDYPVLAAKTAKENGATSVFIVSVIGANSKSGNFYLKTKGLTDLDIAALNFQYTHIFRPSMIMGARKEKRATEKVFIRIWSVINPLLIGRYLNRYKGIQAKHIAKAMHKAGKSQSEKLKSYTWKEMNDLL